MAKLKDLVNVNISRDTISIQGVNLPVIFSMQSIPFLEEAFGKPYKEFELELNEMFGKEETSLGEKEVRLAHALIYSMVRAGGTECRLEELEGSIPFLEVPQVFEKVMKIFSNQIFQKEDEEKIRNEKK